MLSISPQTLASLSAAYSARLGPHAPPIPLQTLLERIRCHLSKREHGGWRVWDTTFARHLALKQSVREYEERIAFSKGEVSGRPGLPQPGPLPVLASACPGWVCYAEKAQADMLPLLSSVRSPQAMMGSLVKGWWAAQKGLDEGEVYHVTAMPCYDKKLEASRSDFYSSIGRVREVDCVLTTGELDLLLQELGFDPFSQKSGGHEFNLVAGETDPFPQLLSHPGTSSGSFLHTVIDSLALSHPRPTSLTSRAIRDSPDNVEYLLTDTVTGEIIFKGAKCYGFRNLQNLVRKVGRETGLIKTGRSKLGAAVAARRRKGRTGAGELVTPATPGTPNETTNGSDGHYGAAALTAGMEALARAEAKKLDYVEVMACPGGCVNGGGQMKPVAFSAGEGAAGDVPMDMDEEGYPRPMLEDGVDTRSTTEGLSAVNGVSGGAAGVEPQVEEGMRWSTKEWVERVEKVYWNGLPTPPASPRLGSDVQGGTGQEREEETKRRWADKLVGEIMGAVGGAGGDKRGGREAEARGWEFTRTRFRKVEGDVLGGGVSLEAVKW